MYKNTFWVGPCQSIHYDELQDIQEMSNFEPLVHLNTNKVVSGIKISCLDIVKDHGSINPSFTLTNWMDNKDFRAIPTLLSSREKWDKYLSDCQVPESVRIAGAAHLVESIATEYWKDKKHTLPRPKIGIEEIQEALNKENRA